MKITKANNQYYAEFVEGAIMSCFDSAFSILVDYTFSKQEEEEMRDDAESIYRTFFKEYKNIEYTGRNTITSCADFICDGQNIELKYVSNGSGTYYNTRIEYCNKELGFTSFHDYMMASGQLELLEQFFTSAVYNNISPVSQKDSSWFRHEYPEIYKNQLVPLDKATREKYVQDFYQYIVENNLIPQFYMDMINKYSKNSKPDAIVVFNHQTKNGYKNTELENIASFSHSASGVSIRINNIKVTFAWQNGTGLNNPTLRVFLV